MGFIKAAPLVNLEIGGNLKTPEEKRCGFTNLLESAHSGSMQEQTPFQKAFVAEVAVISHHNTRHELEQWQKQREKKNRMKLST